MKKVTQKIKNGMLFVPLYSASMVALAEDENGGGIVGGLKRAKEVGLAWGELLYVIAMAASITLGVTAFVVWAMAGKAQDPSKSKKTAGVMLACAVGLGSITAVINMGSQTLTDGGSEYAQYQEEFEEVD